MEKYEMECIEKVKTTKENADGENDIYKTTFSDGKEGGNRITVVGEFMEINVKEVVSIKFEKLQQKLND